MRGAHTIDESRLEELLRRAADHWPAPTTEDLRRMAGVATSSHTSRARAGRRGRTIALLAAAALFLGGGVGAYAVITDDRVTFEEYERAYGAYVQCLRDAGYTVEGPFRFGRDPEAGLVLELPGGDPTIYLLRGVIWPPTADAEWGRRLNRVDAGCKKQYIGDIEERWLRQEAPKVEPRVWIESLLRCAKHEGIEIPASLSYEMLNEVGTDPSDEALLRIAADAILKGCRPWEAGG